MTVIEVELYFWQDLNILLIFFSTCLELIFYEYRLGKAKNCWWIYMAVVNDDIPRCLGINSTLLDLHSLNKRFTQGNQ